MPTLAEQVAALEAERDCLKANQGVDPEYKVNYERLAAKYDDAMRCAVDAESRLAEMQAERDAWRERADIARSECAAAESRLAQSEADAKKAIGHADWLRKKYEDCRADLAVAESRLASARVEAFKAGWNDFAKVAKDFGLLSLQNPNTGPHNVHICGIGPDERFAKLYPAPAAPAGEQTRPAPTPEPEPLVVEVKVETDTGATIVGGKLVQESRSRVTLTPEDCRRIVALGSRPTQTAEG